MNNEALNTNLEYLDMRGCLERITGGRAFSEDYLNAEDAKRAVFIGSLYTHWLSPDMQGIMRKQIKTYIFRERFRNNRDVMFVATDERGERFYNTFPSWLSNCEFDFIEREKLEQYRKLTE